LFGFLTALTLPDYREEVMGWLRVAWVNRTNSRILAQFALVVMPLGILFWPFAMIFEIKITVDNAEDTESERAASVEL
jgi:hypothetical protein